MAVSALGASRPVRAAAPFTDPAPPEVQPTPEVPAPMPQAQAGLVSHAPPRPLSAGAVTHDWRTFLGPTHNSISTETPLLEHFPKTGPAAVWEVPKGEGFAAPA